MPNGTLAFFDGLPLAASDSIVPLRRFLLRKLGEENPNADFKMYWPVDRHNMTLGIAVVCFASEAEAQEAIDNVDGLIMDRDHTVHLERVEGSARFAGVRAHGVIDEDELDRLSALKIRGLWTGGASVMQD